MALCHKKLKEMLQAKDFQITGEFSCKGVTTFGPAKLFGGVNKERPNTQDLEHAQAFAKTLKEAMFTTF